MNIKILEFMQASDPSYGSQAHQALYVRRMTRLQELEPCIVDHASVRDPRRTKDQTDPPAHTAKCYSERTTRRVFEEEKTS